MPGASIHVVDVSRGVVAGGMKAELHALAPHRIMIASGVLSARGLLEDPALEATLTPGLYEALLHVGDYYRGAGVALPGIPFLEIVTYRFGVADPAQHYHLPFKVTPWGFSCFRGGA
jgi:5-hydroxyisourate hydrolase